MDGVSLWRRKAEEVFTATQRLVLGYFAFSYDVYYSRAAASLRLLCVFLRRLANLAFVVTLLQWVMIVCCVHC